MIGENRYKEDLRKEVAAHALSKAELSKALAEIGALRRGDGRHKRSARAAIGETRYKEDLRKEVAAHALSKAELSRALAEIVALREELAAQKPVQPVKVAAPATIDLSGYGTNAQRVAALKAIIGALQDRLKAAGLDWEI